MDLYTLVVVAAFLFLVVGGLVLVVAVSTRYSAVLLWLSAALLIAGVTIALNAARFGDESLGAASMAWLNALLLIAYACLFGGVRRFVGKATPWWFLLAGAGVWLGLCAWPWFMASVRLQVLVFLILVEVYLIGCVVQLWPIWRTERRAVLPVLTLLCGHALFYGSLVLPVFGARSSSAVLPNFGLVVLENILFVIGFAFSIMVLVRVHAEDRFRRESLHDLLTGLANRRALELDGEALWLRCYFGGSDLAVLACDLDSFKQVNDRFGHGAGDEILSIFADLLQRTVRPGDLCIRLGGDEFVVLAPNANSAAARSMANRLRAQLVEHRGKFPHSQTVSIGIATIQDTDTELADLLARADKALYAAKQTGRNCVRSLSSTRLVEQRVQELSEAG